MIMEDIHTGEHIKFATSNFILRALLLIFKFFNQDRILHKSETQIRQSVPIKRTQYDAYNMPIFIYFLP